MSAGAFLDAVAVTCRYFVACVFLVAAAPKLADAPGFERAVANYALLPQRLVRPVSRSLPWFELLSSVALFLGVLVSPVALLVAALLAIFALAVAVNLVRGRRIECGCQGSIAPRTLSVPLVFGDILLSVAAIVAAVVNPDLLSAETAGAGSHASSLSQSDGIALIFLAAVMLVGKLVVSAWMELRSAVGPFATRAKGGVSA